MPILLPSPTPGNTNTDTNTETRHWPDPRCARKASDMDPRTQGPC